MNKDLELYIESEIIPRYRDFDKAHKEDHVRTVIEQSLRYAGLYGADTDMAYAIAAFHDTGLTEGRKTHHLVSGTIIRQDMNLKKWFSEEQIETMAQAAEDHRASSDHEPRSIYGRIVAEADRVIEPVTIIRRTVQYGLSHYPELDKDGQWERTLEHLHEKYAEGGYLKLWIPESPNAERLSGLRSIIRDEPKLKSIFEKLYAVEIKTIRPSSEEDIPAMLELVRQAKTIMRNDGNMHQWASASYPGAEHLLNDIRNGNSYIMEENGVPVATFAFIPGVEPTYNVIYEGEWIDDTTPYATIHRIASTIGSRGVAEACFRWCREQCGNLRIDTHRDNRIMRHVIDSFGFKYCGIIYLANGDERLAYQLVD